MKTRQPFNIFQIIQSLKENYITCYLTQLLKSNFKIYKKKITGLLLKTLFTGSKSYQFVIF